jgi:serine/threonine protein kinase/WD40 repeat protein/Tfp pilus assembly protein PilF
MSGPEMHRNPVEQLAEEFLARYRRGERPSLSEYTRQHPELADEIRDVFPALVLMEEAGPADACASGPCPGRVTADGKVPERLGDYRILRQVGRGGMGVVYEAEQEALGRRVALKVLPYQDAADATRLKRFQREARSAARLHHSNIVPVFDVGEDGGTFYFAMQFIQGQALDEVLRELRRLRAGKTSPGGDGTAPANGAGPAHDPILTASLAHGLFTGRFAAPGTGEGPAPEAGSPAPSEDAPGPPMEAGRPPEEPASPPAPSGGSAPPVPRGSPSDFTNQSDCPYYRGVARIGLQVAEALAYAHDQKVLHRDIKPANLLLDLQGTVWVTDFGLAKDDSEDLTQTGDVVGTLRYMAPERFSGVSDPRSDIYSLGLTVYELLTLRPAFEESDRGRLIQQVTQREPPRPRQLARRIPRDLETILLKATAKEPGRRYATAAELAEDLRLFLADRPILARRSSGAERAWRWCRRNPALAGLTTSVAVLLLVVTVGSALSAWWLRAALADSERAEADGREKLWASLRDQARAGRFSQQVGQRFKSLEALAEAAKIRPTPELRNEAIACLALVDLQPRGQWRLPRAFARGGFDAALERYAFSDPQGNIHLRRVADDQDIRHLRAPGPCSALHFSRDGRYLAGRVMGDNSHNVWDLDRPDSTPGVQIKETVGEFAFSPDSRRFAVGRADGSIGLYDCATGRLLQRVGGRLRATKLALHPQGRQIAVSSSEGPSVQVVDLEQQTVVKSWPVPEGTWGLDWSGDGRFLAAGCHDHLIYVWNMGTKVPRLQSVLEGHQNLVTDLRFAPTGGLLVSSAWDGTTRLWDPVSGRHLLQARGECWGLSADGRRLVTTEDGQAFQLWELARAEECRTLHHGQVGNRTPRAGWVYTVDFHPKGRLLASTGRDGVRFWDVATASEVAHLPLPSASGRFCPQGGEFVTHSVAGVHRWPVRPPHPPEREYRLGPPETLLAGDTGDGAESVPAWSTDGRRLAFADRGRRQAVVVNTKRPAERVFLPHPGVRYVALSPNGRWVATGTWQGKGVKVWDTTSGKLVWERPGGSARVQFSPNGRWLVTSMEPDSFRFWRVGSWQAGHRAPKMPQIGSMAFSPDSNFLAVSDFQGLVRLIHVPSGRKLARLEAPYPAIIFWLAFSPDGTQLAAATMNHTVQLWDLRAIRRQLAALELDWDLLPYPPARASDPGSAPVRVRVRLGDLAQPEHQPRPVPPDQVRKAIRELDEAIRKQPRSADLYLRRSQFLFDAKELARARDDLEQAVALDPDNAVAANSLAWVYVKGPVALRAPAKALRLAQRAVRLDPRRRALQNNLGVAHYRLGQWDGAVAALERAIEVNHDEGTAYEWFFLAISYHQLGQSDRARACYTQATAWLKAHQAGLTALELGELQASRAEADDVLAKPTRK